MTSFRIDPASLTAIRRRLEDLGVDHAAVLGAAGAQSGQLLLSAWRDRVIDRGGPEDPGLVDQRWFGTLLAELMAEVGWGRFVVDHPGGDGLVLIAQDAPEAAPDTSSAPSCHFTATALATFLGGLADAPLVVLELECRSVGAPACHFLVGSPAMIAAAEDLRAAGGDWRELFAAPVRH
ncbi:MAG: V4R domain-containing protein [Gemmatimonadota bacterium]